MSAFLQGRWSSISSSPFIEFNIEWKSGKIYVLLQNLIVLRKQIRLKNCCKCHSSYTSAQSGILCVINRGETTATEPNVSSDMQQGIVLWQALGERKPLKYFCRSLQLGDFAPKGVQSSPEEGCYLSRACFLLMEELVHLQLPQQFLLVSVLFRSSGDIIKGIFRCAWKVLFYQ